MRIAGRDNISSIAATSNGLTKSIIGPVTRTVVACASCSTTVVKLILRGELGAHVDVVFAHAGADDRPVVIASRSEQIVEIDRLMGAVEIADADVNDSGAADSARS